MSSQKSTKVGLVFNALAAVLAIVTLVLYVLNVNQTYYVDMNASVAAMVVGALACIVAGVVLANASDKLPVTIVSDVLRVAAPALLFYAAAVFVGMRAQSLGQIFGSNLELGNESAYVAGTQAIYTIVLFLVSWLVSVIAAFTRIGKRVS